MESESTSEKLIYRKLLAIQEEIGPIAKTGWNDKQKYPFRKIEQVYNSIQPLMVKHGVLSIPQVLEQSSDDGKTKDGKAMNRVLMRVEYTFSASDGSLVKLITSGQGMDMGDKAAAKAMSMAHKYAICQLFSIPYEQIDAEAHSPHMMVTGDAESGGEEYGEITAENIREIKWRWHEVKADKSKPTDQKANDFAEWVRATANRGFDPHVANNWLQRDYDKCIAALPDPSVFMTKQQEATATDA